MECKHAYRSNGVDYIICDCGGKITSTKLSDVAPKLCQHQGFCPNIRNCTLLPSWVNCDKLKAESINPGIWDENGNVKVTKAPVVEVKKIPSKKKK